MGGRYYNYHHSHFADEKKKPTKNKVICPQSRNIQAFRQVYEASSRALKEDCCLHSG